MCESSVWLRYPDGRTEKIADNVLIVAQDGDMVVLRWFLAEQRRVEGTIGEVDAIKHVITLNVPESHGDNIAEPDTVAASQIADAAQPHSHLHPQQ